MESCESVRVPCQRCLEFVRKYSGCFTEADLRAFELRLAEISSKGYTDMDEFLEIVIDRYSSVKTGTMGYLRILFEAADINNDEYLELQELKLLALNIPNSRIEAHDAFKQYSELFLSD